MTEHPDRLGTARARPLERMRAVPERRRLGHDDGGPPRLPPGARRRRRQPPPVAGVPADLVRGVARTGRVAESTPSWRRRGGQARQHAELLARVPRRRPRPLGRGRPRAHAARPRRGARGGAQRPRAERTVSAAPDRRAGRRAVRSRRRRRTAPACPPVCQNTTVSSGPSTPDADVGDRAPPRPWRCTPGRARSPRCGRTAAAPRRLGGERAVALADVARRRGDVERRLTRTGRSRSSAAAVGQPRRPPPRSCDRGRSPARWARSPAPTTSEPLARSPEQQSGMGGVERRDVEVRRGRCPPPPPGRAARRRRSRTRRRAAACRPRSPAAPGTPPRRPPRARRPARRGAGSAPPDRRRRVGRSRRRGSRAAASPAGARRPSRITRSTRWQSSPSRAHPAASWRE